MTVDKTSGIAHNLVKLDEIKKTDHSVSKEVQSPDERDKVEISQEAKALQETLRELRTEIGKIPDVRTAKIKNVKVHIENGIYDQRAVIKETARYLKESGIL
ncbi:MAG: flagellar biosynthesis anti-sigma factor FlgM [Candidatus Loosdrechtia sp.]|uniref:flagellar biosynthesis anti-sigma factor FlgM n=1 Tax=Candidatus Loosdrechtia sp. TaxID=3101272 RepID=UPI003A5F966F|nr:MAG: flagellar biosynthesis anti-sigma factor FlgM [Candidatus Jettenia sp. AMX2]